MVSVLLLDFLRIASNNTVLDSKGATTAQVTPLELTTKLMDAAIKMGTKLVMGAVEGIDIVEGKVVGVRIAGIITFLKKGKSILNDLVLQLTVLPI
jgi:predicted peroxiredoxin